MNIHLSTLSENTASKPGFLGEWGLSIHVQVDATEILFDTGENGAAVENARKLGIDLSRAASIILSHGHADHTGGLREVLKVTGPKKVFAHPGIWQSKYTQRPHESSEAYIGMPFVKEELEYRGASFQLSREPLQIAENVMTTGEVPMVTDYEIIEPNLYIKTKNGFQPDRFEDDLSLIIRTQKGLILILGCAHRGLINHIRHAQHLAGDERVYAVIGGTHLGPASEERLENTIRDLRKIDVQKIGVSHCTGFFAATKLAGSFEDRFFVNNAGTRITL